MLWAGPWAGCGVGSVPPLWTGLSRMERVHHRLLPGAPVAQKKTNANIKHIHISMLNIYIYS